VTAVLVLLLVLLLLVLVLVLVLVLYCTVLCSVVLSLLHVTLPRQAMNPMMSVNADRLGMSSMQLQWAWVMATSQSKAAVFDSASQSRVLQQAFVGLPALKLYCLRLPLVMLA
jgi:type III secretory pathway component EscR